MKQLVKQLWSCQGTALDMMEDVNAGISWVLKRIRHYGGDPNRIYLVGQSCGAQLSMMCLVTQVCIHSCYPLFLCESIQKLK